MPPLVQLQIIRTSQGSTPGVARQAPMTSVVYTLWGRVYRLNTRELTAMVGQQGTVTQETRTVACSFALKDNQGISSLIDQAGNLIVHKNDEIKQVTAIPTEITGQQAWVEVADPYAAKGVLQCTLRIGTKAA